MYYPMGIDLEKSLQNTLYIKNSFNSTSNPAVLQNGGKYVKIVVA